MFLPKKLKKYQKTIITEENKKKPYTDERLAAILKEKGYPIARRTVAKYREQLELPVARLRKEIQSPKDAKQQLKIQ